MNNTFNIGDVYKIFKSSYDGYEYYDFIQIVKVNQKSIRAKYLNSNRGYDFYSYLIEKDDFLNDKSFNLKIKGDDIIIPENVSFYNMAEKVKLRDDNTAFIAM